MKPYRLQFLTLIMITAMNSFSQNNTLIVYFSHTGNTRVIAEDIHEITNGDTIGIEPVDEYPIEYNATCKRAKKEIKQHFYPEIKLEIENIEKYDTIYIGTPNWWNTIAPPVATFLTSFDFKGKTIIPFCTHGGGGEGRIFSDMEKLCPDAKFLNGLSINGYSVNESKKEVENWINNIKNIEK